MFRLFLIYRAHHKQTFHFSTSAMLAHTHLIIFTFYIKDEPEGYWTYSQDPVCLFCYRWEDAAFLRMFIDTRGVIHQVRKVYGGSSGHLEVFVCEKKHVLENVRRHLGPTSRHNRIGKNRYVSKLCIADYCKQGNGKTAVGHMCSRTCVEIECY